MFNLSSELLERVRSELPAGLEVYLVGGAVRDLLLGRHTHDLDFVLSGDVLGLARRMADVLGGAYYPLDEERQTARIVLLEEDGGRQILDFAAQRGSNLEIDLRARDFTVNAMAVSLHSPEILVDPLGGLADLRSKRLRACSSTSFHDDPLRLIRGIRQAAVFGFYILPETRDWMRQAVPELANVSAERLRDELFKILEAPNPPASLRALNLLGVLPYLLPELVAMQGVTQSPPHILDVWEHTLAVVKNLGQVLDVLALQYNQDRSASLALGLVSIRLGRYREQIQTHLSETFTPERSLRALLLLAALYHDAGKPHTRQVEPGGRIRFFEHEDVSAQLALERANALRLSNEERARLVGIVQYHMRPGLLSLSGETPGRRAIYRFFRSAGPAGVDICLLSLADVLATYGPTLPPEVWGHHLDVVRQLLEAWWERPDESVAPPPLLNGKELIRLFRLQPGPQIGRILEAIREAQAVGQVDSREEAIRFVQEWLGGEEKP